MSTRYQDATFEMQDRVKRIKETEFPQLDGANIMTVMDTKKKVSGGRIVVARIKKMNDELKFFTTNEVGIVYDYVMFVDHEIFEVLDELDKNRVIYHELCHTDVNQDKASVYGIKDHEIQGFYDEADYNADDPRWAERVADVADSVYDDGE